MAGTVSIGCKLPAGVHLCVYRMEAYRENIMGGGWRDTERAVPVGRITIAGTGRREDDPRIVGGYALTHNVDADVWAEWLKTNGDSDLVRNNLVFAAPNAREASATAKDGETLRSGQEPINMFDVPPEFRNKVRRSEPGKS